MEAQGLWGPPLNPQPHTSSASPSLSCPPACGTTFQELQPPSDSTSKSRRQTHFIKLIAMSLPTQHAFLCNSACLVPGVITASSVVPGMLQTLHRALPQGWDEAPKSSPQAADGHPNMTWLGTKRGSLNTGGKCGISTEHEDKVTDTWGDNASSERA